MVATKTKTKAPRRRPKADIVAAVKALAPFPGVLIAVVDGDKVTVRVAGKRLSRRQAGLTIASRLVEIESVLDEFAPSARVPITEEEDRTLAAGGAKDRKQGEMAADNARVRAAALYSQLLRQSYSTAQAAEVLGVNTSRIRQRLSSIPPTLYGIRAGKEWRIPRFQFQEHALVPGLDVVLQRLPTSLHPVAVYNWFTTPQGDLCDDGDADLCFSPIEWLQEGRPPRTVAELAAGL